MAGEHPDEHAVFHSIVHIALRSSQYSVTVSLYGNIESNARIRATKQTITAKKVDGMLVPC